MPGFPIRTTRTAYGPAFRNAKRIRNPEFEMSAEAANLELHQVAGMNLLSPMAAVEVSWDGAAMVIHSRDEAWNPDGLDEALYDLDATPASRTGAGIYVVNYKAQYPDEVGSLQTINIRRVRGDVVAPPTTHLFNIQGRALDANSLEVRIYQWEVGVSVQWALADRRVIIEWY